MFSCSLQGIHLAKMYQMCSYVIKITSFHQTGLIFVILVISSIHQWNGFDLFSQSFQWYWCMFSLHIFSESLQLYIVDCGGYCLCIVFNSGESQLCSEQILIAETINKSHWANIAFILLSNNSPRPRTSTNRDLRSRCDKSFSGISH